MAVSWLWSGGITDTSARVVAALDATASSCRLVVSESPSMTSPSYSSAAEPNGNDYCKLEIGGLTPGTPYYYQVEIDSSVDTGKTGEFTTYPAMGDSASFKFGFASCNDTGSNHGAFVSMADADLLFFFHLGDKHYANVSTDNEAAIRAAHESNFAAARQNDLHRLLPVHYMWDDHDFGSNDCDRTSESRRAVGNVYREMVPHYDLSDPDPTGGIYHSFDVGRIRFIVTDNRTYRHPNTISDASLTKSMLGVRQKQWFKDLVATSAQDGTRAIVWANTCQWSMERSESSATGEDTWDNFYRERDELSAFMRSVNCPPVVIISGDAHEVAARLDYRKRGMRFAVFQSAAIDQSANTRNGYWDYGPSPGTGRWSTLEFTDNGDDILTVDWRAYTTSGTTAVPLYSHVLDLEERRELSHPRADHNRRRFT